MLDIKFIRENKDLIKEAARKKKITVDVDRLIAVDEKRRSHISEADALRATHKTNSDKTSQLQGTDRDTLITQLKESKDAIAHKEFELRAVEGEFNDIMMQIPNIPDPSVPEGDSDADNKEIRDWSPHGEGSALPTLASLGGRDYMTLMAEHDMADLDRGTKVAGFRGYFLKNDGAMLEFAIWRFAMDHIISKGFIPFITPSMVRRENFLGTGWFPQAKDDVYKTQDDLYLSGTAEVPMMGYHADEIFTENNLPKKYVAFSPCFRREIGSHGKDTKGIIRVHEFFKVEQVILCKADHQESVQWHEALTKNSEEIMQLLEIPHRVVLNCGGDIGLGQVKKYDIEGWVPSENKYRETHSASYFHDFQTRRLNIKYRDAEGKIRFAHSLNNTALAMPRILVPFLENHQQPDGSIKIPKALQTYLGKEVISK